MLTVCSNLFTQFKESGVPYCHWKSNEHLRAGLKGDTDLDVLVNRNHRQKIEQCLNLAGFKRFRTASFHSHPSTEDYFGFDEKTGKLVHIHLHYRLILGGDLKQYHVPWNKYILDTRTVHDESGVYISDPNVEMILLLVRYALKLTLRDRLRAWRGESYPGVDIQREYDWLQDRIEPDVIQEHVRELIGSDAVAPVDELLDKMSTKRFRALRRVLTDEFDVYRTYSRTGAWLQRHRRQFLNKLRWHSRNDLDWPHLFRRTLPSGGLLIAVVGADGSGKSTASSALAEWLSWKLDVYQMYMGSNDVYSFPKRLLRLGKRLYTVVAGEPGSQKQSNTAAGTTGSDSQPVNSERISSEPDSSLLGRVWDTSYALVVSYEKRKKLKRVWHARNKGTVVVTDRFPQNQKVGINDGPLLDSLSDHSSITRRVLSRWEREPYEWVEKNPPDLVVKLNVDPQTALNRDQDGNPEQIRNKCDIVRSLSFEGSKVVEIDATNSKDEVLHEIKKCVWEKL